jgi:hypothetical protein
MHLSNAILLDQIPAPAAPSAGDGKLYLGTDRRLHTIDENSNDFTIGQKGNWDPDDHGIISWAYDPVIGSTGSAVTAGVLSLTRLNVKQAVTATSIYWHNNSAGTVTSGQNFIGLYDSTGTRLVSSAIAGTSVATGFKTQTISQALLPGFYWVAFLFNGTTMPQPIRLATYGASPINVGLSAAQTRFGTILTGQTSLPTSFTPSSIAQSALSLWAAIG